MAKATASKRPAVYTLVLNLSEEEAQDMLGFNNAQLQVVDFMIGDTSYVSDEVNERIVEALSAAGVSYKA